jgi:hypothetical protein
MNVSFPEDAALALDVTRRFVQWLKDEKAQTGLTDDEIAAKYEFTFEAEDKEMMDFIERVKSNEVQSSTLVNTVSQEMSDD